VIPGVLGRFCGGVEESICLYLMADVDFVQRGTAARILHPPFLDPRLNFQAVLLSMEVGPPFQAVDTSQWKFATAWKGRPTAQTVHHSRQAV
jgi:hypothetical protein